MEPTIYKPSIYKGAGIYKAGTEGGGGDTGYVIFGGISYPYKKINGRLWITKSLKNVTTNSYATPRGDDAGLLYPYIDFPEIESLLHDGWRMATLLDYEDLINSNTSADSSTFVDISEGGTNDTGFSLLFIGYINQNGSFVKYNENGLIWTSTVESSTYMYNAFCRSGVFHPNDYSNKSGTKLQIRLCKYP